MSRDKGKDKVADVPYLDDPRLWCSAKPLGIWSIYANSDEVLDITVRTSGSEEPDMYSPSVDSRICDLYDENMIPMYEVVFKEIWIKFPFSQLQRCSPLAHPRVF